MKRPEGHLEPEGAELQIKNPRAASIRTAVGEKQQQQFHPPPKSRRKFRAGAGMASDPSLSGMTSPGSGAAKSRAADSSQHRQALCSMLHHSCSLQQLLHLKSAVQFQEMGDFSPGLCQLYLLRRSCRNFKQSLPMKLTRGSVEG